MKIVFMVVLTLLEMVGSASAASDGEATVFFDRTKEGWFWYLNHQPTPDEKASLPDRLPPSLKEMQARAEELLSRAIGTPTEVTVAAYMGYQQLLTERAERFARVWQRVLWAHPELDPTVVEPVAAAGMAATQAHRAAEQERILRELSESGGILYFYKGDCPICSAQSPLLSGFSEAHGFRIVPISLDGFTDPIFPGTKLDHGAAEKLGVKDVPAIFLARPPHDVRRVGTGFLTIEELGRRLIRMAGSAREDSIVSGMTESEENANEDYEGDRLSESDDRTAIGFGGAGGAPTAAR